MRWVQSEEAQHCTKCLIGQECLTCRIVRAVKEMKKASGGPIRPAVFVADGVHPQEDAHEFLIFIINSIDSEYAIAHSPAS